MLFSKQPLNQSAEHRSEVPLRAIAAGILKGGTIGDGATAIKLIMGQCMLTRTSKTPQVSGPPPVFNSSAISMLKVAKKH